MWIAGSAGAGPLRNNRYRRQPVAMWQKGERCQHGCQRTSPACVAIAPSQQGFPRHVQRPKDVAPRPSARDLLASVDQHHGIRSARRHTQRRPLSVADVLEQSHQFGLDAEGVGLDQRDVGYGGDEGLLGARRVADDETLDKVRQSLSGA